MNYETIAARIDAVAMATGVLAGLAAVGAALATPTGLTAFGVWLGLIDEPLIIKLAPIFDTLATVSGTVSGAAFFYAKRKKRQFNNPTQSSEPVCSDAPKNQHLGTD